LGAPFALGEVCFHKIKDRETLSRPCNNFNTNDDNSGLTERFSVSTELRNVYRNLKFVFEISFF
jgi:hypothetical protein